MEYLRYIVAICYYEDTVVVVSSERSLVRPALENIKLVNYKDRIIATVILIKI